MKTRHVAGQASRLSPLFSKLATGRKPVLLGLLLWLAPLALPAQTYSIDWYKVAGGGGTSTGGVYSVSGTAGQQDAGGPMTNGQYSVTGGFWALPISTWSFTNAVNTRHIGPMAQDFHAAFGMGDNNKTIGPRDANGVALAAIQGLNQKLQEELGSVRADNAALKARLDRLEQLINTRNGGGQ